MEKSRRNPIRESGLIGQLNKITDQIMFYPEFQPVFRRGCLLTQSRPKFRNLGTEELKLAQSLTSKHFVLIDQWGQIVQLICYESKMAICRVSFGLVLGR